MENVTGKFRTMSTPAEKITNPLTGKTGKTGPDQIRRPPRGVGNNRRRFKTILKKQTSKARDIAVTTNRQSRQCLRRFDRDRVVNGSFG
jgi:hypothetical protein